jgi:hypothetical protein
MILEGAYEATLLAAAWDRDYRGGSGIVFLTMLGGGVFENKKKWIREAISKALKACPFGLDVRLCHFQHIDMFYENQLAVFPPPFQPPPPPPKK